MMQQRRLHGGGDQRLKIAQPDFRVGVFAGNNLSLLGDADLTVHAARRLRQNGIVARAAAATDCAAPAVEQAEFQAVFAEYFYQFQFCLIQLPVGRDVAAVLVAVRITQHHFLGVSPVGQQPAVVGNGEQFVHDGPAAAQVLDGFKQRDDIDVQRIAAFQQACLLQHQCQFQHVAHRIGLGDDVIGQCGPAKAPVYVRCGLHDAQLALYHIGVFFKLDHQRLSRLQRVEQRLAPLSFVKAGIIADRSAMRQQFADGLFVYRAVLAHIQWRQMKTEHLCCAAQIGQASACQISSAVLIQRVDQYVQIGDKLFRRGVRQGRLIHRRQMRYFVTKLAGGGRQTRINQYQCAAIRLIDPADCGIRRSIGKAAQVIADIDKTVGQGEAPAQKMCLFKVMLERYFGMLLHRKLHDIVRHERIAVAVAAYPAAYFQQGRDLDVLVKARFKLVFQIGVNSGDFLQKGVAVKLQSVIDFVVHGQLGGAQHARLPEDQYEPAQSVLIGRDFIRRHVEAITAGHQAGDGQMTIEYAFTLHFSRVCGQYGRDQRVVEKCLQGVFADRFFFEAVKRKQQAAVFRRQARLEVCAMATVVVQVFGDVG